MAEGRRDTPRFAPLGKRPTSAINLFGGGVLLLSNDFDGNSPIKAPLTEDCRSCAILVVMCAGTLICVEQR
jgi:hypothetical protein